MFWLAKSKITGFFFLVLSRFDLQENLLSTGVVPPRTFTLSRLKGSCSAEELAEVLPLGAAVEEKQFGLLIGKCHFRVMALWVFMMVLYIFIGVFMFFPECVAKGSRLTWESEGRAVFAGRCFRVRNRPQPSSTVLNCSNPSPMALPLGRARKRDF